MAHLKHFRIGLLAALGLIVVATIYLITGPALLNKKTIRTIVTQNLRDWTGASVSVNGPTKISFFPRPKLKIYRVNLAGIKRLPLIQDLEADKIVVELGLWSLISGTPVIDRVTLIRPQIKSSITPQPSGTQSPAFVHALASAPFDQIRLLNGKVAVTGPQATEEFTNVTASIDIDGSDGAHSSGGSFTWRKQPVSFGYNADALSQVANAATMPITVKLDGELFSAEIDGSAVITNGLRVTGDLDLEIPNLPNFAKWTGMLVPDDQSEGNFAAEGTFYWAGHRIGFDEGTFDLDGNRALGAMALEISGPRPQIEGTLALQKLDLTRYFAPKDSPHPAKKIDGEKSKTRKPVGVDFPLLHHINIDLRISTTQLTAGPLKLGQSAISFSLKSGILMADLAVFEVCEGNANARLSFNATLPDSAVRVTGGMAGISAKSCIEVFIPDSSLEGTADVSADVTSKGRTTEELFESLNGKITFSLDEGKADIDIPKLVEKLREGPVLGWKATQGSATSFQSLAGEFFLRRGAAYTDSLKADLGETALLGEGTIDFASKILDMRLLMTGGQAETAPPPKTSQGAETPDDAKPETRTAGAIVIKGPWSEPTFSLELAKSSAQNNSSGGQTKTALRGGY